MKEFPPLHLQDMMASEMNDFLGLASRLIFGSNPPGIQNLQDADQANQLSYDAETVNLNWIHNSSSNLLISNNHDQQLDQKPTFLTSEDVEDFLNFISENTINTLTEDRPPAQENEETEDRPPAQ